MLFVAFVRLENATEIEDDDDDSVKTEIDDNDLVTEAEENGILKKPGVDRELKGLQEKINVSFLI